MAEVYSTQCGVAVSNSYDSCGTITRADISYATPTDLVELFQDSGTYRDMKSLLATSLELKACGTRVNGLHDWLMSSAKSVGGQVNKKNIRGTDSILEPFILAAQKSVINKEYWAITNGYATGSYTPEVTGALTSVSGGTRVVRVVTRYGLDLDEKDFTPGGTVHIFTRSSGTAEHGQWKIVDAAVNNDDTVDILLASQNAGSSDAFDATPTDGILIIGTNNVNDFEKWCNNRPARNPNKLIPFWFQTSRFTLCIDSFYREWLTKLMATNDYFKRFGDVPLAERNRQLGDAFQREWCNSFFWGKPIGTNQSLANWQSLESINSFAGGSIDPGTGGKLIAKRANAVGVYEQLRGCGRVRDLQNQKLNLVEFFNDLYDIKRARESQGKKADSIDVWTDSRTAAQIDRAMFQYYQDWTADGARYVTNMAKTGKNDTLGFNFNSYLLKFPIGMTLNVVTNNYFDDFVSAAEAESIGSTARFLMVLDLGGGIYPGIISSNRKVHKTGEIQDLGRLDKDFACVMENPTQEVTLNSVTWTAIVECPEENIIYRNFDDTVPEYAGVSGEQDGYGYV